MKNKRSILITLLVLGVLILAACSGGSTEEPEQTEEAGEVQPIEGEGAADVGESDAITMYIGPELVECTGVAPQTCMQVKYSPEEAYQLFYNQIEGFTYEPGYNYELKVMVTDVENPPADGSALKYSLIEEVSKTPADAEASTMPATDTQGDAALTGTYWTLSSYADTNGNMVDVLPEAEITAVFGEDGSLSGSSGCNNYNTSYQVDGNNITVNEMIAATMMACPEPIMAQETAYLANLPAAATFEIAADTLTLMDASGNQIAVFTAQQPDALVGTNWEVLNYNNGKEAVITVLNGTKITAVFGEDGTVSGNASCNTYNAPYEVDGSSITIGIGMTTMMACPGEGVMEQETAYLAALTTAATYSIQGDVLELRTADGALAVSYVATEPGGLAGNPWLVTSYNNGRGGAVSPIIDTELTLEFLDDGNVTGSAGCNRYFGPYVQDGEAIQIGPLATTRAFCPDPEGAMDQEQEFLTALQSAATYTISNDKLDLRTSEGSIAVIAVPQTP
jgi:heat shock protein HslJ